MTKIEKNKRWVLLQHHIETNRNYSNLFPNWGRRKSHTGFIELAHCDIITPRPAPSLSACSAWTWGTASAATRTARSSPSSPTAGSAPPAQLVVKAWIQASGSLIWIFWTLCLIYWWICKCSILHKLRVLSRVPVWPFLPDNLCKKK